MDRSIMPVKCWYLKKEQIPGLSQKKTPHSCCLVVSLWENASYGGILFHQEESALNRRKKTGNREGSSFRLMITRNLFRFREINPKRLVRRHLRRCRERHTPC